MLTLLGSFLGFASSALTIGMKTWQQRGERQHQLAVMKLQMQVQREGHNQQVETAQISADIAEGQALYQHASQPSGIAWIEGLRASVRPLITYAFFFLFAAVKLAALVQVLGKDTSIAEGLLLIWDDETQALFAAVMSFWFGQRALNKLRQK